MGRFKKIDIKSIGRLLKAEGISLRRRFILYIISAIALVLSLVLLLLSLFGIMNPANAQIMEVLDAQLLSYADNVEHDYNKIAACAISFADQIETALQNFQTENNLSFEELKNNPDALSALQKDLYGTVYLNLQLAPSSGVFYILDTTVNSHSETPYFNGVYLKCINLYSETTVNNEIALYRGSFSTGKEASLSFHSGWRNEMRTDFFDHCDSAFSEGTHYLLSPVVEIPDTWERARYVYVPICDLKENIIGVCGFEVNDLYFQLSQKGTDSRFGPLTGALLDGDDSTYTGQFNYSRYNTASSGTIQVTQQKNSAVFDFGTERCIGKTRSITLGGHTFTVALMLPEAQFSAYVHRGQMKTAGIISFIVLFMLAYCLFVSKKYVAPILKRIEQIKISTGPEEKLKIREIDDLFATLAERDSIHEEQLRALEAAKQAAEEEAQRSKAAYEKALKEYELAKSEIQQLSNQRKQEIALEDYEYFICNLRTLTPTEHRIYTLYLEGKTATEIANIMGIKENTMKYHNRNIYSKLGVSSRKQLLRLAALKQQQDQKGTAGA